MASLLPWSTDADATPGTMVWWYGTGMVKATFTLDEETVQALRTAAERLRQPQSAVVRSAIRDYAARLGRLSEQERSRLLAIFDRLVPAIPARSRNAVDQEIAAIRASRRRGGRLHPAS